MYHSTPCLIHSTVSQLRLTFTFTVMMYRLIAAVALLAAVSCQLSEDRTLSDVTSGLTKLLTPNVEGPYPPAVPEQHEQHQQQHYSYYEPHPQQPHAFSVQTGYEGIIAPTGPAPDTHGLTGAFGHLSNLHKIGGVALGAGLLTHLLPFPLNKIVLFLGTKVGAWVLGLLLLGLVGGAATTAVCALTPLCTISFLGLRLNKESVRSLLSQDRIDSVTQFVHDAIDKYRSLQKVKRDGKAIKKTKKYQQASKKIDQEQNEGSTTAKPVHPKADKEEVKPVETVTEADRQSTTVQ